MKRTLKLALHNPQRLWIRKAMFQVHLWAGLIVALYVVAIGISGSILVFRTELEGRSVPAIPAHRESMPAIGAAEATTRFQQAFPGSKLTFLYAPTPEERLYRGYISQQKHYLVAWIDPATGNVLGSKSTEGTLLGWIGSLHYFLLMDRANGLFWNGIGGACLLLLTASGMVLWWPGIRRWTRGLFVNFKLSWKRINYDSHNVIGFWTLTIVSFWAISGIYFAWPKQVTAVVNAISPVSHRTGRITVKPNKTGQQVALSSMLATASVRNPGYDLLAIRFPAGPQAPLMLYMAPPGVNIQSSNYAYLEPATGKYIATVNNFDRKTVGDWIIWAMRPVHFGTAWGLGVKILYFILGMSLPFLVFTGTLMYWHRYLGKKWSKIRATAKVPAAKVEEARPLVNTASR